MRANKLYKRRHLDDEGVPIVTPATVAVNKYTLINGGIIYERISFKGLKTVRQFFLNNNMISGRYLKISAGAEVRNIYFHLDPDNIGRG